MSAWEDRLRAPRVSLPDWARDAPDHCLVRSNASGTWELYTWDAGTAAAGAGDGVGELRQATDRANGTVDGTLSRDGRHVWWYDDADGDEYGTWQRQPFGAPAGSHEAALPGLPPAYDAGLAFGPDSLVTVGSVTNEGSVLRLVSATGAVRELYRHPEDASLGALSPDGTLVAVSHSEHGDSRHPALRVLRAGDGSTVAELWDGAGRGVHAVDFAPRHGDPRLLVVHERRGRPELLIWDVRNGEQEELPLDLPGEISADWVPDGSALLVSADAEARSTLWRLDLATRELTALPTPRGVVLGATERPDGAVWFAWSSAAEPATVRDLATGAVVLRPPGDLVAPPSVGVADVFLDGPGGRVHALLSLPRDGAAPHAAVFAVHGGPEAHDEDAFRPDLAAWVDHGYAVVNVNYRGSDGYGSAWRDAIVGRVGLTELEDLAAVRAHLVAAGTIDPARVLLAGGSWGGYLTLLGLGVQPELWAAGLAAVPVADYVTAYDEEMEGLQAFDRALFGGTPQEVPDRYAESSPLTYVTAVRAPLWVSVGENDPRCPSGQVDRYLEVLAETGRVTPEVLRFDAGHGSLVVAERIRQLRAELTFALAAVPPG